MKLITDQKLRTMNKRLDEQERNKVKMLVDNINEERTKFYSDYDAKKLDFNKQLDELDM